MATLGDTSSAQSITTAGLALLDDAAASDQRTTLGLGSLATQSGTFSGTSSGTNTGDQTLGTTAAAVGTSAGGAATSVSKSDHVHATGAGTPTTQAIGDAAATGSGPAASMTDHKHAMPAFGTSPAAVGTQANGSSANIARIDHVHATGAGTPSTQAFGDAAAVGTGPAAAMTDHKHAMPATLSQIGGITSTVSIANTETVVKGLTIPANRLAAGSLIRFRAVCTIGAVNTASWILRLRVGPTTLIGTIFATGTVSIAAASNGRFIRYDGIGTIRTAGAGGTGCGEFTFAYGYLSNGSATGERGAPVTTAVAVDTTVQNLVELTFISGDASNTYVFEQVLLEVIF